MRRSELVSFICLCTASLFIAYIFVLLRQAGRVVGDDFTPVDAETLRSKSPLQNEADANIEIENGQQQITGPSSLSEDESTAVLNTNLQPSNLVEKGEEDIAEGDVVPINETSSYASAYRAFIPKREGPRPNLVPQSLSEEYPSPVKVPCNISDPEDRKRWEVCDPPACRLNMTAREVVTYQRKTAWGEDTGSFVNRVLRKAWGPDPPVIDLYLRTFCPDAAELALMLQSLEVFWPRFLGHILIVLDRGNEDVAKVLLPQYLRTHSYRVIYEPGYCMHGRVYSQYSYINVGMYSKADYIVTFDGDASFFHPVTPDLLFTHMRAKMIMPTSQRLAAFLNPPNSNFDKQQYFYTNVHDGQWGTMMVTQPISFKLSTFGKFIDWINKTRGTCYEDLAARFARSEDPNDYRRICWMCQMGVFVGLTKQPEYDLHILNKRPDPYLRFAAHYKYEHLTSDRNVRNVDVVSAGITQGLCKAFGEQVFPECKSVHTTYVDRVRTHAGMTTLNTISRQADIDTAERALFSRLKRATVLAMNEGGFQINVTETPKGALRVG